MLNKLLLYSFFGLIFFWLAVALAVRLYPTFFIPGFKVTSWFRSTEKNLGVGGVPNSLHLIGWAVDGSPNDDSVIQKLKHFYNDIIIYPTFVHAEFDIKKILKGLVQWV